jgi:hypothetical protein
MTRKTPAVFSIALLYYDCSKLTTDGLGWGWFPIKFEHIFIFED